MDEQNGLWMKYLGRRPWCTTVVSNFLSKRFNSSTGITNVPAKEGFEEAYFAFSIRNICIHWSCTTHARRGVSIDQDGRLVSKLKKRSLSQKEKEGPSQKEKEGRPGETRPGNGILNLSRRGVGCCVNKYLAVGETRKRKVLNKERAKKQGEKGPFNQSITLTRYKNFGS
jgi:hypothetical protein